MNNKALKLLKGEEEIRSELHSARLEIEDLERELDWMHSREPDEFKYIAHLEGRVRELLAKIERLDEDN